MSKSQSVEHVLKNTFFLLFHYRLYDAKRTEVLTSHPSFYTVSLTSVSHCDLSFEVPFVSPSKKVNKVIEVSCFSKMKEYLLHRLMILNNESAGI